MKKIFTFLITAFFSISLQAQISINTTGVTYTENFNGIGSTATASIAATGFKIGTDWATGTTATTAAAGTSGTGIITGSAAGGVYNWANGVTASSTDRALGFLFSSAFGPTRNIVLKITNNSTFTLTDLAISFDYEKYRSGSRAFDWTFNHGGTTATPIVDVNGNQNYPADANNNVVSNPPVAINKSFTINSLNIPAGSDYYLKWTYAGLAGGSNSQGIGIDNFTLLASGSLAPDITSPAISTLTPVNNATNVSIGTNLQMVFNEAIIKGAGNIVIKKLSDNSTAQTIGVNTAVVTVAGNTATITINPLVNLTDYYVEVDAGTFTDNALNNFAGITGNTAWSFTTIAPPAAGIIGNNYGFTNCATTFLNEGWTQYSVTGTQTWACATPGRAAAPDNGIQMNAYITANNSPLNEDWLISPVFDLSTATAPTLKFYSKGDYVGNSLQLKISSNYIPGTNPNTALWTDLNGAFAANVSSVGAWKLSDNIDLTTFNTAGITLAWVYVNPTTANSSRWTIDDVSIYTGTVLALCDEPTDQPTNLSLTPNTTTITGISTPVTPSVSGYLIVRSTNATLSALPIDATNYILGQPLGGGVVIANSSSTVFTDNMLNPSTQYYYFVFAYNNENCVGGPNYLTTINSAPTGNTNSTTTTALAACIEPTFPPNTLVLNASNNSITGSFQTASTANRNLVIMTSTSNPLNSLPVDGATYAIGTSFGGGTVLYYGTASSFTATGLMPNTTYYFYIFSANGDCVGQPDYYTNTALVASTTTLAGTGAPTNYYNSASNLTCQPLKTALRNIISAGYNSLGYSPGVWNIYLYSDMHRNDADNADIIWDMYSDNPTGAEPYTFKYGPASSGGNQCGGYSVEGDCYNREHSSPQSWFNEVSPMVSDVHHIFATDGKVNGIRSNFPYGEVTTASTTTLNGGKLGLGNNFGYTATVFEPINAYKGDFARAGLYMAVRYENEIISQNWSANGNANQVFLSTTDQSNAATRKLQIYDDWYLKLLYKWHIQDPVSQKEIDRNNAIYYQAVAGSGGTVAQSNRNPFVDHPEYAAAIWGNACLVGVIPVTYTDVTAKTNKDGVLVNWNIANEININYYEVERSNDGVNFYTVGSVYANNVATYAFTDNMAQKNGVVFYRIKAVNFDGKLNLSKIVSVKIYSANGILVYPNPATSTVNIKLSKTLFAKSNMQITDITGKIIKQQTINAGENIVGINTSNFVTGKYFIKIINGTEVIIESFVVIK